MGLPVKLTEELVETARQEIKFSKRSVTAQVEYWASIGRLVEMGLPYSELRKLSAENPAQLQLKLSQAFEAVFSSDKTAQIAVNLREQHAYLYEEAADHPGHVYRLDREGSKTLGRFQSREFVEVTAAVKSKLSVKPKPAAKLKSVAKLALATKPSHKKS